MECSDYTSISRDRQHGAQHGARRAARAGRQPGHTAASGLPTRQAARRQHDHEIHRSASPSAPRRAAAATQREEQSRNEEPSAVGPSATPRPKTPSDLSERSRALTVRGDRAEQRNHCAGNRFTGLMELLSTPSLAGKGIDQSVGGPAMRGPSSPAASPTDTITYNWTAAPRRTASQPPLTASPAKSCHFRH